jgi:hypothetical protein
MQDSSYRSPEQVKNDDARLTTTRGTTVPRRGIKGSIWGAFALLIWDAGLFGSFLTSFLFCPIWFLVSIVKNAIQRPGWTIALIRITIPPLTLALVLANNAVQLRIAEQNAPRVAAACEQFYAANGKFPKTLDELVPRYLPSVPRAKYCYGFGFGEFVYMNFHGSPILFWYVIPPHGRRCYDFEHRRWRYLD